MSGTGKMKLTKRFVAVLMAVLMFAATIPGSVFAAAEQTVSVVFHVADGLDNPIEGATVSVDGEEAVETSSDGTVRVYDLEEDETYTYTVTKPGYASMEGSFIAGEDEDVNVVLMELETVTVTGTVVDETEAPVEGAAVVLINSDQSVFVTGSDGRFAFNNVYVGQNYMFEVSCTGFISNTFIADLENVNTLKIVRKQAAVLNFEFGDSEIGYGDSFTNVARTDHGDTATEYSSENEAVATVNKNGVVTTTGVGQTVITATIGETDYALGGETSYILTIVKGNQKPLAWTYSIPQDLTWQDSFINYVTGGSGEGAVVYTSSDTEVADVDPENGEVTFHKPGTVTITATKLGGELYEDETASYTITVKKAPGAALTFSEPYPDSITYGETYTKTADYEGDASAVIIYTSSDETVATVDQNGTVTPVKAGTVTITATVEGNELYEASTASYTIVIMKADQVADFHFVKANAAFVIKYGDAFENEAVCDPVYPITYESSDETIAKVNGVGQITTMHPGEVTISATIPENDQYKSKTISYLLTIEKGDLEVCFAVDSSSIPAIVYGEVFSNPAVTMCGTTNANLPIEYSSSDESVATVDTNGNVTAVGVGTVTITASTEGNECYNGAEASYTLNIGKAQQTVSFEKGEAVTIRFNDNENVFVNIASTDAADEGGENPVTYTIIEGQDFAEIPDEHIGELHILGACEGIKVKAEFAGNDFYEPASAEYVLIVNKANQAIQFTQTTYTILKGTTEFVQTASVVDEGHQSTGSITYSVTSEPTELIIGIDAESGMLTISEEDSGEAVVTAIKAGDANYNAASATYTLKVLDNTNADDEYFIVGDKMDENSEWYTSDVEIIANNGYQISFYSKNTGYDWKDRLIISEEGINGVKFVIRQQSNGGISSKQNKIIKIDKTMPAVSLTSNNITVWEKILTIISFGAWGSNEVTIDIDASDEISRVKQIWYLLGDINTAVDLLTKEELDDETAWIETTNSSFTLEADFANVFYVKVRDVAGNYIYANTNGVIFDGTAPEAEFTIPGSGVKINVPGSDDPVNLYGDDIVVSFTLTDQEPSSGIAHAEYWVECDGADTTEHIELYSFDMESFGDDGPAYSDLEKQVVCDDNIIIADANNSDDVVIFVKVTDNAGNEQTYSQRVAFSTTAPEIVVTYVDDPEIKNEYNGVLYFDAPRCAKVEVIGRDSAFVPDNVIFTVNESEGSTSEGTTYSISAWTSDGDTHTAYIYFNGSAQYSFTVDYTDAVGHEAVKYISEQFAVDLDKPTGTISIGEDNTWEDIIETLTFGLWSNETVTVTATADDATSPIKSVEYFKTDEHTAYTKSMLEADGIAWLPFGDGFTVEPDELFAVYLKITDYAEQYDFISTNGYIVDDDGCGIGVEYPEANEFGFYNEDIEVAVAVEEPNAEKASGIAKIEYMVSCNGMTTHPWETLFEFGVEEPADEHPTYDELVKQTSVNFTVVASENDGDDVRAYIRVTDNAGNETWYHDEEGHDYIPLKMSVYEPQVKVEFDNNDPYTEVGERGYYKARTAFVYITERETLLYPDALYGYVDGTGIVVTGVDSQGNEVVLNDENVVKTYLGAESAEEVDKTVHKFKVEFIANANYDFTLSYTNKAGNTCPYGDVTFEEGTKNERYFTVDNVDPIALITIGENSWDTFLETLTFGLWTNEQFTVTIESEDATSPLTIEQYMHHGDFAIPEDEFDGLAWEPYSRDITLSEEQQTACYFRVTDYAGNRIHLDSDGHIVDYTAPVISIVPEETDIVIDDIGVYNHDVSVDITVTDNEVYSGIKSVEYWVETDGNETQRLMLYKFEYVRIPGLNSNSGTLRIYEDGELVSEQSGYTPTKADLKHEFTKTVVIDSVLNNNCSTVLHVETYDNAGNYHHETVTVDIDITAPVIDISYDNNDPYKIADGRGYYPANRTATIVVTERTHHFDPDAVKNSIVVTGVNSKGEAVSFDLDQMSSDWSWTTETKADDDLDTHTLTIAYTDDANYTFSIDDDDHPYIDMAGKRCAAVNTGDSSTPYTFTVDKVQPFGTVTVEGYGTWDKLIELLTFGLWSRTAVTVTGTSDDETSPIESVSYYKTSDTVAKTESDLKALPASAWAPFNGFDVAPNEQFTVYIRIVDYAGNTTFISTDGVIVDSMAPVEESIAPEITVSPMQPVNGIYNTDVDVAVEVVDPLVGGTYSGLNEIRYEVYNMGSKTQEGVLYRFDLTSPIQSQLLQTWKQTVAFTVESAKNNSNNVEIKIFAVDNSGNASEQSTEIKIDITNPTISVSYDNNDPDPKYGDFFNNNRTAKIVVTERNFDPKDVTVKITNTDGSIPALNGWKTEPAGGNGDGTTHTAYITYSADGDYTFDISCIDLAGNASEPVNYGNSVAPTAFTIDKTAPVVTIVYDNNDALNGNYYKKERTATITVVEHNFDENRTDIFLDAKLDGQPVDLPVKSEWKTTGNTHVMTIYYPGDALYAFDFDYTDMAGNRSADIDRQNFHVDKTMPEVRIEDIVDESANNDPGSIGFSISATDINFDVFKPMVTVVKKTENGFETVELTGVGEFTEIDHGRQYKVDNLDSDGIYSVTCEVIDKAGNAYNRVIINKADGTVGPVELSAPETLITFSVNREGSTFDYGSEYTKYLVDKGYVQSVKDDVVLVEINPDPLNEEALVINLNEKTLVKGEQYTVSLERSDGSEGWYKYSYTLKKDLFKDQNTYRIETLSKDKAGNDRSFGIENSTDLIFNVDKTAPIVTVTGIVNDGRYQTDELEVAVEPEDPFGILKSIKVMLVDNNGEVLDTPIDLEGDAFRDKLEENNGKLTFKMKEGLYQNVRIVCDDIADYDEAVEENIIYDETITNVSVASSALLIYWANKPLRYGTMGGAGAVGVGAILLAVLKKRKKKERK